jgi:hypothetical protein
LPGAQQGSILGSWLAITQVGFPPTKVRGIAKPLLSPISCLVSCPFSEVAVVVFDEQLDGLISPPLRAVPHKYDQDHDRISQRASHDIGGLLQQSDLPSYLYS